VEIQRLLPDEWSRFKMLRLAALRDEPNAFGSMVGAAEKRSATEWRQQVKEIATYVVVIDGIDVGLARGAPDEAHPNNAFLISMWVSPDARKQGVGEQLIRAIVNWAQATGFRRVLLDVADENTPAVALHERMNFQPTGETGTLPPPRTHIREHRRVMYL